MYKVYTTVKHHNVLQDIMCYSFLKVKLFCCALSIQFFLICLCREFLSLFNHVIFVIKKYIFPMQIFVWSCMRQNISKNPLFHFKFALSNQKTENTIRLDFLCWLRIYNSFWIYSNGSKDTGKILFFSKSPNVLQTNKSK
jgi:hypothetical protein